MQDIRLVYLLETFDSYARVQLHHFNGIVNTTYDKNIFNLISRRILLHPEIYE